MSSPRLSAIAVLGAAALLMSGCAGTEAETVGVDELRFATLGAITPAQQAFVDRLNELSEGTMTLTVTENWQASGGDDTPEVALSKAVFAGDVDVAWVTVRSLSAAGISGLDALEAPLLVQTHDQQRAVANGVPGELITNALRTSDAAILALMPGPTQYPVAVDAPLLSAEDFAGKTIQVGPSESAGIEALGATAASGTGGVVDVVSGAVPVATGDPTQLEAAGVGKDGPFMTSNIALWPRMSAMLINRDVLDSLSNRQHGFVNGSVVRAQDVAMADLDLEETVAAACDAGIRFGLASAEQREALLAAAQPAYAALRSNPGDVKLLEAIEDAVKRTAGTGSFPVPKKCRWKAPD